MFIFPKNNSTKLSYVYAHISKYINLHIYQLHLCYMHKNYIEKYTNLDMKLHYSD